MRALVTGVSRGIGRSICLKLAEEALKRGERPCILATASGRSEDIHQVVEELREMGAKAQAVVADLAQDEEPTRVVQEAISYCGGLDALVNNAALSYFGTLRDVPIRRWDRLFSVNVRAPLVMAREAFEALKASKGAICAVASTAAELVSPQTTGYSSSKAALVMLMQQIAYEWGPEGIRANCVSPGLTRSRSTEAAYGEIDIRSLWEARLPLRRVAEPEDIAAAVAFLVGPESRYITGENLNVDGGMRHIAMEYLLAPNRGWGK